MTLSYTVKRGSSTVFMSGRFCNVCGRVASLLSQPSASLACDNAYIWVTLWVMAKCDQKQTNYGQSGSFRSQLRSSRCEGLTGYYRRFIPEYASLAVPLTDLTRKSAPTQVQWTGHCDRAFQELKQCLCVAPVLWSPNLSLPFVVQTDASDQGIGAVLSQVDADGNDHPIAYFSRKLLPCEVRYSTVEKECLAIRLGVHAFRVYLLGQPFKVQTDHRALQWLDRLKESCSRLMRWSLALQQYQFVVEHRAGSKNANADSLSRIT